MAELSSAALAALWAARRIFDEWKNLIEKLRLAIFTRPFDFNNKGNVLNGDQNVCNISFICDLWLG